MKNQSIQAVLNILLITTSISIFGCSKETSDGTADVSGKPDQPSLNSAETAYKNRMQQFPAGFPLPQYPNSQVEVAQLRMGKKSTPTVVLQTNDSVNAVFMFYAKSLKKDGWDIGKVIKNKTYVMLAATRNGRESTVMITETRSGTTAISLFAGKK